MSMKGMRLQEKVLVVIGGTSGLGLSAAKAFIREGACVVAVGRSATNVASAENKLGSRAKVLRGDASNPTTAKKAIQCAIQNFGGFHGLYHVAGGSGRKKGDGPLHELTNEGWDYTLKLNLNSLFYSNREAVRHFLEEETEGTVLNMASVLAFSPCAKFFATHAYSAAKAAITGLTRSAAAYYAHHNIRFNALAPALVETSMSARAQNDPALMKFISTKQPLDGGRIGEPADLDASAVYFMSDDSKFVTGQILSVDGGWGVTDGQFS